MEEVIMYKTNTHISRTPELIAAEINSIKNQTRKMMIYNSIEIGRRLIEAKVMLQHGEWGKWLEEKVDYSQRTANNLMRIFEEYGSTQITLLDDNSNSQAFANLSYSQAVALLGIPETEREAFVEEHDIENMSTRELQQAIKEREAAQKEKEEALKQLEDKSEEAKRLFDEKMKAESEARLTDKVLRETQEKIKTLEKLRDESEAKNTELRGHRDDLMKQLKEAQTSSDDEEAVRLKVSLEEKEKELEESLKKIKELKQELKDKPETITTAVVEKIPEEAEKELAELRKKVQSSQTEIKFNVHFDTLVKDFKDLLGSLTVVEEMDPEAAAKYKNAVKKLISMMIEKVS